MKCVLIQRDSVHIEDAAGTVLFFRNLEDVEKYTKHDLSTLAGKRITYQPDDKIHDWDGVETPIPYPQFEHLITNIEVYKQTYEDPYTYASLAEAKEIKISEIFQTVQKLKRTSYSAGSSLLSLDGIQSLEDIQTQAVLALSVDDTEWTIDVILEDTNPDGTNKRVPFSASEVVNFIRELWKRNEGYNQLAQDRIDAVNLLATVEDVIAYNIVNPNG